MIFQTIYSSAATVDLTDPVLADILTVARERNAAADVTGVLIVTDGLFLQVLEGPHAAVTALLAKISLDPRHRDVTVFHAAEQPAQAFPEWRMAHISPDAAAISRWAKRPGTTDLAELRDVVERNPDRLPGILSAIVEAL